MNTTLTDSSNSRWRHCGKMPGQGSCQYWVPFSNSMAGSHPLVLGGSATNPDYNPALSNQPLYDYMVTTGVSEGETSLLTLEGIITGSTGWEMSAGGVGLCRLVFSTGMKVMKAVNRTDLSTTVNLFPL